MCSVHLAGRLGAGLYEEGRLQMRTATVPSVSPSRC